MYREALQKNQNLKILGGDILIKEILEPRDIKSAEIYLDSLEKSKILAGGTDLIPEMQSEKNDVLYLISLNKIDKLKHIKEFAHHVMAGSMATFSDMQEAESIKKNFGCIFDCCKKMGSPQIRNTATIGGNIVNSAPAADLVPCLMISGTVFLIESSKIKRRFKCEEYFENISKLKIADNEILTQIIMTKSKGASGFYKLGKRNSLAISRISAACYIEEEKGKVLNFKVALGAVAKVPMRLYEVEDMVKGKNMEYLYSRNVVEKIKDTVYESIKERQSAPFKKEAVEGVYNEALKRAVERLNNTSSF